MERYKKWLRGLLLLVVLLGVAGGSEHAPLAQDVSCAPLVLRLSDGEGDGGRGT